MTMRQTIMMFSIFLIFAQIFQFVKAQQYLCEQGPAYICLNSENAAQCGMSGSLSESYCAGYSKQQEKYVTCGEGGVMYWCNHKEKCGVTSEECTRWLGNPALYPSIFPAPEPAPYILPYPELPAYTEVPEVYPTPYTEPYAEPYTDGYRYQLPMPYQYPVPIIEPEAEPEPLPEPIPEALPEPVPVPYVIPQQGEIYSGPTQPTSPTLHHPHKPHKPHTPHTPHYLVKNL